MGKTGPVVRETVAGLLQYLQLRAGFPAGRISVDPASPLRLVNRLARRLPLGNQRLVEHSEFNLKGRSCQSLLSWFEVLIAPLTNSDLLSWRVSYCLTGKVVDELFWTLEPIKNLTRESGAVLISTGVIGNRCYGNQFPALITQLFRLHRNRKRKLFY